MGSRPAAAVAALSIGLAGCELVFPPEGGGTAGPDGRGDAGTVTDGAADGARIDDAGRCTSLEPACGGTVVPFQCGARCYALCTGPEIWDSARSRCQGVVADLASIGDIAEDTCVKVALADNAAGSTWIGLAQEIVAITPDQGWSWTDGSVYTPFGWRALPQQPNDTDGNESDHQEQCGYIDLEGWADRNCVVNSFPFVCEAP